MAPRKKTLATSTASPSVAHPPHEEIALRAYEFFVERGGIHGRDLDDWLKAEHELAVKYEKPLRRSRRGRAEMTLQ